MKKGAILLLLILILLKLVNAQEVTILGNKYPLLLVVPVAFMSLIVLFFIGIVVKDALGSISLPKLKLKPRHHEVEKVKDDATKYKELIANYNTLKNKSRNLTASEYFDNLVILIKDYLKFKHNINQEFIFEEVPNFKKVSQDEINLANKIVSLKYSGVELTHDNIKNVDNLFKKILKLKPEEEKGRHKVSIFSKIKNLFIIKHRAKLLEHKEPEHVIKYKEEKVKPFLEKEKKVHHENLIKKFFVNLKRKKILKLINYGKGFILKNPVKAKRYFGRALLEYHKLNVKKDDLISKELEAFSRELLKYHPHEKHFFDISKKIVALKHSGKRLTFETLNAVRNIKNLLKHEERLIGVKLKEFSKKLELEKKKLEHLSKTKEKQNLEGKEVSKISLPEFPKAPKLKMKELVKEAPEIIKPKMNIHDYPKQLKQAEQKTEILDRKELPYKKLLPNEIASKTLSNYKKYGAKLVPREKEYKEHEVLRDYVLPNVPKYTIIKHEKKYITPEVPRYTKISQKKLSKNVEIIKYKPQEIKEISETKAIPVKVKQTQISFPKLKIKKLIKEIQKSLKPKLDIDKFPEVPEELKKVERVETKKLPYKKLLPENILKKTLESYSKYGIIDEQKDKRYSEREVLRDYVTPDLPRYTTIKQEKKYVVPDVPISIKISKNEIVTPEVGIFRYKTQELNEPVKEIKEPKKITVKLEPPEPPLPFEQTLKEDEYKKILSNYKRYGEVLTSKEKEYNYAEYGKEIKYIKHDLPSDTKIKQEKFIMPMPKIETVKDYNESKRVNEIKREEEEIYKKLLKLESF